MNDALCVTLKSDFAKRNFCQLEAFDQACQITAARSKLPPGMESASEREQLERFGRLALADAHLREQLRATADENEFAALAVRLAAERGCFFTAPTVVNAVREKRRAWLERWL